VYLAIGSILLLASFGGHLPISLPAALVLLLVLALLVQLFDRSAKLLFGLPALLFGAIYLGFLPAHLLGYYRLGPTTASTPWPVFFVLALVWAADTAAYLVGSLLGRHKLWPRVSPSKSWEGAAAGFLVPIVLSIALGGWVENLSIPERVVAGILVGLFAQLGDMGESLMKREASMKDSGTSFPGHGGILDRIDSLALAVPVLYYWLRFAARTP
jgi:phosphatidate cytidylyltransferase